MMTSTKILFAIILFPAMIFAQEPHEESEEELFKVVEDMPRFPGCENMKITPEARTECAKEKLLAYVFENLKYPQEARDKKVEGMAVLQFVVTKEGSIDKVRVVRDPGSGCGEAALEMAESMNRNNIVWKPGLQRGKAVNVLYTLPIKFKLDDDGENVTTEKEREEAESESKDEQREIFKTVHVMPRFPGCENMKISDSAKEKCAKEKMLKYIYGNLIYPDEAMADGVEGLSIIQFVVAKDGALEDVMIVRDPGSGCGESAKKLVEGMNEMPEKWTPGLNIAGETVNVLYTLPIKFRIGKEKRTKKKKRFRRN